MDFGMIGPAIVLCLGCMGSAVGCALGGMASHAVMARVEEGHGKFIGMSAFPSSVAIYGFILEIVLSNAVKAGTLSALNALGIGLMTGIALLVAAVYQGWCCATGIQASAKQPGIYGKCFAAIGIVEGFALFTFVFALLIIY